MSEQFGDESQISSIQQSQSDLNLLTKSISETSDEDDEKEEEPQIEIYPLEILCEYVQKVVKLVVNKITDDDNYTT